MFLRKSHFACNENSTACPPCNHQGNEKLQLLSRSPDTYGDCAFNGTILTIPQTQYLQDAGMDGDKIVTKETINAAKRNTYIMAIIDDVNDRKIRVSHSRKQYEFKVILGLNIFVIVCVILLTT